MKRWMPGGLKGLAGSVLAVAAALGLTACGGGGAEQLVTIGTPLPFERAAELAGLKAYSKPSAQKATLTWNDQLSGETGFRVDKFVNNAWTPVATLPPGRGGDLLGESVEWTGPLDATPTRYRVMALRSGGDDVALKSEQGAAELKLGMPPEAANTAIALNMPEPARGDVKLSVTGAPAGSVSAMFHIDDGFVPLLPASSTGPAFETPWRLTAQDDGSHKVTLKLQHAPGTWLEIERTVVVAHSDFSARFVSSIGWDSPTARIYVIPTGLYAASAASATLSIDGKPVGTLTGTACHVVTAGSPCKQAFLFEPSAANYDVGTHQLQATVTAANGLMDVVTGTMAKPAPLKITLTSPLPSRFTTGQVQIRGELTGGDPSYSAYLKVTLTAPDMTEQQLLLQNGYGPFSANVDLTGRPDGIYGVTVEATALVKEGGSAYTGASVLWQAKPPMAYELVKDLPEGGNLLASGNRGVLMGVSFVPQWIVPGAAADIPLLTGRGDSGGGWQFAGNHWLGWIYGESGLYAWGADGMRQAVSDGPAGVFSAAGSQVGWLQNVGGKPTLWLSNLAAPAPVAITMSGNPTAVSEFEGTGLSLGIGTGGKVVAAYAAVRRTPGDGVVASSVYSYDAATLTHRRLSAEDSIASAPVTDGKAVAWGVSARTNQLPGELWLAPVDGSSAPVRLSASLSGPARWVDGLLVWQESSPTALKVYRNGVTTTLPDARLAAVGSGAVAYRSGTRLYVWTPDKGERLVHGMVSFDSAALADGWLYFTVGSFPTLYRVPL